MSKITIILCFFTFFGLLHTFPVQDDSNDDQKDSSNEDTGHIADLTPGHQQLSKTEELDLLLNKHDSAIPENNTNRQDIGTTLKHTNVGDASAIPAVYVTPFPKRVARSTTENENIDSEVSNEEDGSTGEHYKQKQKNITLDDSNEENLKITRVALTRDARDASSSEENDSSESSTPLNTEEVATDDDSAKDKQSKRVARDTQDKQESSESQKNDQNDSNETSTPTNTEEVIVGIVGSPLIFLADKANTTDQKASSTEHTRVLRDTEGKVPASYQDQQSSTLKTDHQSSLEASSTQSFDRNVDQSTDRQVRDTEGKVSQVPGSYQNQQSSTQKTLSEASSTQTYLNQRADKTQNNQKLSRTARQVSDDRKTSANKKQGANDDNNASSTKSSFPKSQQDEKLLRVGRSAQNEKEQRHESNYHSTTPKFQNPPLGTFQSTVKSTEGQKDLSRTPGQLSDNIKQQQDASDNKKQTSTVGTKNSQQDQTVYRYGRDVQNEDDQNKKEQNEENKNGDSSSVRNPIYLATTKKPEVIENSSIQNHDSSSIKPEISVF